MMRKLLSAITSIAVLTGTTALPASSMDGDCLIDKNDPSEYLLNNEYLGLEDLS